MRGRNDEHQHRAGEERRPQHGADEHDNHESEFTEGPTPIVVLR
jgi:hypothetical protein